MPKQQTVSGHNSWKKNGNTTETYSTSVASAKKPSGLILGEITVANVAPSNITSNLHFRQFQRGRGGFQAKFFR
jgi:hypothetical protein